MEIQPRGLASSISHDIESVGRVVGKSVDDVLAVCRNVTPASVPDSAVNVFKSLPVDSFAKRVDEVTTATGRNLSDWSSSFRKAADGEFEQALRDIRISPDAFDTTAFKQLNRASFPEFQLGVLDDARLADKASIGDGAVRQLDNLDSATIDDIANRAPNDNVVSSTWDRVKTAGKVTLAVGVVAAAGYIASQFIADAIAVSSGCFLVFKDSKGALVWQRVIGYTCGDKRGDSLWVAAGRPVAKHPLASYIQNTCSGIEGCGAYCNPAEMTSPLSDHLDLIPANATLICRTATISDVLSEVADDLGTTLGDIAGGVVGGVVGGVTDGLGVSSSLLWIIAAVVIIAIVGIIAVKALGSAKQRSMTATNVH